MNRLIAAALLTLASLTPAVAEDGPSIKVAKILETTKTTIGQPLVLPAKEPQLIVSTYDIAPGARLPRHKHPFARYAYVLQGDLTVEYEGGQSQHYRAGDFIVEAIGVWHFGMNSGSTPVRLLVIDQVEAGKPNTILAK